MADQVDHELELLLGTDAVRLIRMSRRIWAKILLPLIALVLVVFVLVRVVGVPASSIGPFIGLAFALLFLGVIAAPVASSVLSSRAARAAGSYLDTPRYTGKANIRVGILRLPPKMIRVFLLNAGIPLDGVSAAPRMVLPFEKSTRTGRLGEMIDALHRSTSASDWNKLTAGFITLAIGTVIATVVMALQIARSIVGPTGGATPGTLRLTLFAVALILIAIGAVITQRILRRNSSGR